MKKALLVVLTGLLGLTLQAQQVVEVDLGSQGPAFDGIGAVSTGASSKLLFDYPEPERSAILDWLFLPGYGASLHHLKVEIGGDVNTLTGTEPSIAHTREEFLNPQPEFSQRGSQLWLMKEAKKRNPDIILEVIQWGAPGWIGNGEFFSQENADLIVRYLLKAKDFHGIEVDYCGIWNERFMSFDRPKNVSWVKLLKSELRRNGLNTKIVAMDEVSTFNIAKDLLKDPELMDAVDVLGSHYQSWNPLSFNEKQVLQTGKPLWSTEDGPWRTDWEGAKALARLFNRNYITFGMTKTLVWSLITAHYENLPTPVAGLVKANTPWNRHFEITPTLRAVSHFTLFTQPGWKYLPSSCGLTVDQTTSYTTLASHDDQELTILIETIQSAVPQMFNIKVPRDFANRQFYLWRSDSTQLLVLQRQLETGSINLRITLDPGGIYTLTTIERQNLPKNPRSSLTRNAMLAGFPLPYGDAFHDYPDGSLPRYTQDQGGVFEVVSDGENKILRQMVPTVGIEWSQRLNPEPYTMLGDLTMRDYALSIDVLFNRLEQVASVMGRVGKVSQYTIDPPPGYWLRMVADGNWALGRTDPPILQGKIDMTLDWPMLKHSFPDHTINVRTFRLDELEQLDPSKLNLFKGLSELLATSTDPENLKLVVSFDGNYYVSRDVILEEGHATLEHDNWNNLKIKFSGDKIYGYVNDMLVVRATDSAYPSGMAGFGCGWHQTDFDNLQISLEE